MMKNILISLAAWTFFLFCLPLAAAINQSELNHMAQRYLSDFRAKEDTTAIAITVRNLTQKQNLSTLVETEKENQKNILNPHYLFQIGSVTKSFIAILILKLEDNPNYHFNLNDPLGKFLPQYKKWQNITIKNLLQMTSGIPDYLNEKNNLKIFADNPYQNYRSAFWLKAMYNKPLLFKAGTQFNYSNTNYILLSLIIEKITGHSIEFEISENILRPLKLLHTYYIPDRPQTDLIPTIIPGYQAHPNFQKFIPFGKDISHYSASYLNAAGCMYATTDDVTNWVEAIFTPGKLLTASQRLKLLSFISEKTARPITILTRTDQYAYGLGISAYYDLPMDEILYLYEGVTLGYRMLYVYAPREKIIVTIAVNSNAIDPKQNRLLTLAKKIIKAYSK